MTGALARRVDIGILLAVLLAFCLRLYAIDRQDIWGDEAFSIWLSSQPLPQVVAGGADTHPPLYPFLLYLWLRLAGSSPLATRFLSAWIGTLTVSVVYAGGRRALGRLAGAVAVLLAAVSPVLIYYSQETRMYGLVTLLAAASVYWAIRTFRQPSSAIAWLAYWGTTLGAVYTHYYAFFIVLAENLILIPALLRRRQRSALTRWCAVQGMMILVYLPWIAVQSQFLSGKASARFTEWGLPFAGHIAGQTLDAFAAGLAAPALAARPISLLYMLALLIGLLALVRCRTTEAWLIVTYLSLPLVLAWAVNPIMPFFYPRYLLLIAPAFYLVIACGLAAIGQRWRPLGVVGMALLLVGSGYGLWGYYNEAAAPKGRYGQMMAYIQAQAQPGDGLILANPLQRPIFEYYRPDGLEAYYLPRSGIPLEDPRTASELTAIAQDHPRLWLVRFGNPAEYDPDSALTRWLALHGSKAYSGGWVDADLSLYVMAPAEQTHVIQHPLRADLGDQVQFLGYALNTDQVAPADTLLLTLYWQALQPIAQRYTVFTHLLDAGNRIQAQIDSEPLGGALPTDHWQVGEIIQDNYALIIPDSTPPGPHVLEVGMYRLDTMGRLPVRDPDTGAPLGDRVLLGQVTVVAP